MTQLQMPPNMPQGPVVQVKPEPNIYTVLLMVTCVVMLVAIVVMFHNLMGNYGLSFGDVLSTSVGLSDPGAR